MRSLQIFLLALTLSGSATASLAASGPQPRALTSHQAARPEWTVRTGNSEIEMLPEVRLRLEGPVEPHRRQSVSMRRAQATDPTIGQGTYGLAYNRSMQAYGALTGEISFNALPGTDPARAMALGAQAGLTELTRLGHSDVYLGQAASPQVLREALLHLRQQPEVARAEWAVLYNLRTKTVENELFKLR